MNCTDLRKQQLNGFGFKEDKNPLYPNGDFFSLDKTKGLGGYWLYDYKDLFAISMHDFSFFDEFYFSTDMYIEESPTYLSLSHNINIDGKFLNRNISPSANTINGFLYGQDKIEAIINKNTKVYSMSIEIYPKYYEYLTDRFKLEENHLKDAFLSFKGDSNFYEMMVLLNQIKNFKATGASAEIFYESKVNEAIALTLARLDEKDNLVESEYLEIQTLNNYILQNLDRNISQRELCDLAFMGKTKLQSQFKKVNKLTVGDFIKINRLEKAKSLLIQNDYSIKEISHMVGYPNQSRFTEVFKEYTNILPSDYKKRP